MRACSATHTQMIDGDNVQRCSWHSAADHSLCQVCKSNGQNSQKSHIGRVFAFGKFDDDTPRPPRFRSLTCKPPRSPPKKLQLGDVLLTAQDEALRSCSPRPFRRPVRYLLCAHNLESEQRAIILLSWTCQARTIKHSHLWHRNHFAVPFGWFARVWWVTV